MKQKKKSPFDKYKNWIGMGLVLLVFIIVLLVVGKPSQSKSKPSSKKVSSSSETERTVRAPRAQKKRSSADRLAEKAQRKLERERKREEKRKGGTTGEARISRTERSTRETRTGMRTSSESGYVLKGIFVDERGERYALFGERRTRNGDMVAGRKIHEVESDRVSVEYGGSTYEVKIGNSLY
jgi:hypothetical protein